MITSHNLILPKYLRIVKEKGSRISKTRAREGGASVFTSFILSFLYSVPPSARKKFWPSNQAGEKEGGWGERIFARLFCAVGAVGWGFKSFERFCSKKVRTSFSNCDQSKHCEFCGQFVGSLAPPAAGLRSHFSVYFGTKAKGF